MTDKAPGPNHTRDVSQSFLSTFGHTWIFRSAAALGLKHSPIFGTRVVLCCYHGLCSCRGLARNYTEGKLLREGRASKGTTCTSCIRVQAWVEELESVASG